MLLLQNTAVLGAMSAKLTHSAWESSQGEKEILALL